MIKIPITLTELYKSGVDVRDCYIPDRWRDSFNNFIMGQACYMLDNEFCYYSGDFARWYYMNKLAIERDEKIDSIIE